jgi:hypothetical protein
MMTVMKMMMTTMMMTTIVAKNRALSAAVKGIELVLATRRRSPCSCGDGAW